MHAESPRFSRLEFVGDKLRATLTQLLEAPGGFLWVAEHEGRLIGGMAAVALPHWCSNDLVASDLALFVAPQHRGGLAVLRLVNRYRKWAQMEMAAAIVQLGVSTGVQTETTTLLFERLGFKRCGAILEA